MSEEAESPDSKTFLTLIDLTNPPEALKGSTSFREQSTLHQSVMSLFPEALPGPGSHRRATSRILFRSESLENAPRLLVQSAVPPSAGITKDITEHIQGFNNGDEAMLRVQMNTVICKARSNTRVPVPADELENWFHERFEGIADAKVLDVRQLRLNLRKGGRLVPLATAVFDVHARISNSLRFHDVLRSGIGRGRAYGCGLVTAARV
jgi:CRISPR system Cascade subunit CasE